MNFIKPTVGNIVIKSENKMFMDFEHTNLPINLNQIISFEEVGITSSGIKFKIPSIRFITASTTPLIWCFSNEKDKSNNLLFIQKQCKLI